MRCGMPQATGAPAECKVLSGSPVGAPSRRPALPLPSVWVLGKTALGAPSVKEGVAYEAETLLAGSACQCGRRCPCGCGPSLDRPLDARHSGWGLTSRSAKSCGTLNPRMERPVWARKCDLPSPFHIGAHARRQGKPSGSPLSAECLLLLIPSVGGVAEPQVFSSSFPSLAGRKPAPSCLP